MAGLSPYSSPRERGLYAMSVSRAKRAIVRAGGLKKPATCSECGEEPRPGLSLHGHHDDYNRPLDVRWLCPRCHRRWHGSNKAIPLRSRAGLSEHERWLVSGQETEPPISKGSRPHQSCGICREPGHNRRMCPRQVAA